MKKLLKFVGTFILLVVVFVLGLVLALPLWIGPAAKWAAGSIGPKFTGTPVHLGEFSLNPYTGRVAIGDLQVANPPEYSETNAVDLQSLKVNVAMTSVFSKKLRVEEVLLDGLRIHISPSGGNMRDIAKAAGGNSAAAEGGEKSSGEDPAAEKKGGESGGGVEIDRVELRNITVKYLGAPISVPTVTLEGIGADTDDGASWSDAWEAISGPVAKAAGIVTGAVGDAAGAAVDAAGAAAGAVKDGAGAVIEGAGSAIKGAGNAIKDAGGAIKGLFK